MCARQLCVDPLAAGQHFCLLPSGLFLCLYRPAKVTGHDHPDVIVETATLASVVPPNPTYAVHQGIQVRAGRGGLVMRQR